MVCAFARHCSQTLVLCLSQVVMSKFDTDKYIPYEKMSENLKIVRDRLNENHTL